MDLDLLTRQLDELSIDASDFQLLKFTDGKSYLGIEKGSKSWAQVQWLLNEGPQVLKYLLAELKVDAAHLEAADEVITQVKDNMLHLKAEIGRLTKLLSDAGINAKST